MLNDYKFNYLTGNDRFRVVCATFNALPCTCRWWLFLITGSHAFVMGDWQCLLCRADGAESINQGCALNEAVSYVVLTLFAEEAWRWAGHEKWKRKAVFWLSEGVVPCRSSQWQRRCEVLGSLLFYPKRSQPLFIHQLNFVGPCLWRGRGGMIQVSEAKFRTFCGVFLSEIILVVWLTMKPSNEWKRCRNRGIRTGFSNRNILI